MVKSWAGTARANYFNRIPATCLTCGNEWIYKGNKTKHIQCSKCKNKRIILGKNNPIPFPTCDKCGRKTRTAKICGSCLRIDQIRCLTKTRLMNWELDKIGKMSYIEIKEYYKQLGV